PRVLAAGQGAGLAVAAQVGEVDLTLRPALRDGDEQPAPVGREVDPWPVGAIASLAEDLRVARRIVAQPVQEDAAVIGLLAARHLTRLRVARVVEAAAVGRPGQRAGPRARDLLGEILARLHVANPEDRLLAAVVRHAVGDA